MITRSMPWYEFAPGTIEIDEFDCASIFLFLGKERALLLDTGTGIGDLKGLVESITSLPYDVVLTHGHMDHVGGCGWFPEVYINEKELALNPFDVSVDERKWYANVIMTREHKNYNYDVDRDIRVWPAKPLVKPLYDGQQFDLGGRVLTFYECPGHCPGEMVMIDPQTRILFSGDAVNNNLLFKKKPGEPGFVSVEDGGKYLERIWEMRDRYDHVMNSHHDFRGLGAPLCDSVMPNAIKCCKDLADGTADIRQMEDALRPGHMVPMATVDEKSWVAFTPEGIKG